MGAGRSARMYSALSAAVQKSTSGNAIHRQNGFALKIHLILAAYLKADYYNYMIEIRVTPSKVQQ
ncbi:MAG: hypothetical protein DRQ60_10065 [Gammaproteobacteria bacterium]|nr:MAG: hypothetical protein DRQ60_10065 [Gammaproteobacteria bacterium]